MSKKIEFVRVHLPYRRGEAATFSSDQAMRFVRAGTAVLVKDNALAEALAEALAAEAPEEPEITEAPPAKGKKGK